MMLGADKLEFAPLLPPGRHLMTANALAGLCVGGFETSASRPRLMSALTGLLAHLGILAGVCDLWVDGSFVTAKPEPGDVDVTVIIEGEVFDALEPDAQQGLAEMAAGAFFPDLHVFIVVTRPRGHPDYSLSNAGVDYWAGWWAVTRGAWLKGMPVIRLGETDVGLRLLS